MNCWHRLCPFCTMSERLVVGLRYCGGCNPRYNRTAAVEQLRAVFPDVVFCPAARGQALVLVVCGFLLNGWAWSWIAFPIGGMLCAAVSNLKK